MNLAQHETYRFELLPFLLGSPLKIQWSVRTMVYGRESIFPLSGRRGKANRSSSSVPTTLSAGRSISIPAVCHYSQPLPIGILMIRQVQIDFRVNGNTLIMTNRPTDGNYWGEIIATAIEPNRRSWTVSSRFYFRGDYVNLNEYNERFQRECSDPPPPPLPPPNIMNPEWREYARILSKMDSANLQRAIIRSRLKWGNAIDAILLTYLRTDWS